ncbi:MAG: molecular chaperone DnaJ [Bacteroidota bacterium]
MVILFKKIISSLWMIVALVEFLVILYLLIVRKRKPIDSKLREEIMGEKVDFGNLIDSAFHANTLWDELRKKCHPDLFGGDEVKTKIAGEIQAAINENKNNIKLLNELKVRAENELGVKFKIK